MPGQSTVSRGVRALLWLLLGTVGTVITFDRLFTIIAPADARLLQAEDGVRDFQRLNPTTLVLGSSHARSFRAVADLVDSATSGREVVAIVPEEGGLFQPYEWLTANRLLPIHDARVARARLRRVVLVTTFYDMCELGAGWDQRLAAHGWTFGDFLRSVSDGGLTSTSRNYLRARWSRLFPTSSLVQDRGVQRIQGKVRWKLTGAAGNRAEAFIASMRAGMELQYEKCWSVDERAALRRMLEAYTSRGLETIVVLFPLDPRIVSPTSQKTTLARYATHVQALADSLPIHIVDLTASTPMVHEDFQEDLDHIKVDHNLKFARWVLKHELRLLLSPPEERK